MVYSLSTLWFSPVRKTTNGSEHKLSPQYGQPKEFPKFRPSITSRQHHRIQMRMNCLLSRNDQLFFPMDWFISRWRQINWKRPPFTFATLFNRSGRCGAPFEHFHVLYLIDIIFFLTRYIHLTLQLLFRVVNGYISEPNAAEIECGTFPLSGSFKMLSRCHLVAQHLN